MKITQAEIKDVLHLLAETPERITAASQTLITTQLDAKPYPNAWSINEILAHLRACADVWGKDIDAMLAEDTPTLRHISPRTYLRKTNYLALEFAASFQMFTEQRRTLLVKLHSLNQPQWARGAEIKGRQHTVFSQARRLALHEADHCEQIEGMKEI